MKIQEILQKFKGKRILVVGDVMIDAYMLGKVHRVSPEAPVPIVSLSKQEQRLGGAANVALNLQSLGAVPVLCSVLGNDYEGRQLKQLVLQANMPDEGFVQSDARVTTIKTRVIGNNQHLLRIDAEDTHPLIEKEEDELIQRVESLMTRGNVDAVILEDYNKGVLTPRVIDAIITFATSHGIPTTVDPKKDNFLAYRGVTLFKPNFKELKEGLGISIDHPNSKDFEHAVQLLESKLNNQISFVTLSEHGVFIKNDSTQHWIPAHIRNIADVSGAGDTVISVATLCLVAGCSLETIASLSNLAGGLVCEKSGVVSIEPQQLLEECAEMNFN